VEQVGKRKLLAGLDVGTTKTCAFLCEIVDQHQLNLVGAAVTASAGLKRGTVVDIPTATETIRRCLEELQRSCGKRLSTVHVTVSGSHVSSHIVKVEVPVKRSRGTIAPADVERLMEMAHAGAVPEGREILAALPLGFMIDGTEGIRDPIGMYGHSLGAEVHLIMGAVGPIQNLIACLNGANIGLEDAVVAQGIAAGEAVLTEQEKQLGVAVVDIGGGTTDIVLYINGAPWHTASIPLGGTNVTNDIAYGLRVPVHVAEEIKLNCATVDQGALDDKAYLEVPGFSPGNWKTVRRSDLAEIVCARMEEILGLVKDEIRRTGYFDVLPAGVVLTGGGSELRGLVDLASAMLELPVRQGFPPVLRGMDEHLRQPAFASAIGLVMCAAGVKQVARAGAPYGDTFGTLAEKLGSFVRSFIPST